jgi:hypothetical protein
MAIAPNFAATPRVGAVLISTADTSRSAPTNVGTVLTAGSSGSRIDEINVVAMGTTTANVVRLFLFDGTNYFLMQEVLIAPLTPSVTAPVVTYISTYSNLMLPNGWSLRATTNNAESYEVLAFGGDF